MAKLPGIFLFCLILAMPFLGAYAGSDPAEERRFFGWEIFPEDALNLLAEAKDATCQECIKANLKKARALLDKALRPGTVFSAQEQTPFATDAQSPSLLVLKSGPVPDGYPKIALQFHTEKRHWPGVKQQDFTNPGTAAILEGQAGNYCFAGRFALVACPYGDGDAFYYDSTAHSLVLHIRFLELDPASCP